MESIAVGSDGALWFTAGYIPVPNSYSAVIGRAASDGTIVLFTIPNSGAPLGLAAGSDGALWVTAGQGGLPSFSNIARITTSGTGTVYNVIPLALDDPYGIAAGPDGALWYTGAFLGRITTSGLASTFNVQAGGGPNGIAAGPDGALWFAGNANGGSVGRITTSGTITNYPILTSQNGVEGIAAGPDGAMWFTETTGIGGTGAIGRITAPASTSPLVAAVLPSSRSVQAGGTATAFATIINSGTSALTGCAIAPVTGVPATFLYQTTIPTNNALTGTANTPVSIPAGGSQSFFIALTTNAPFVPVNTVLGFDCANTDAAQSVTALNTLLLSGSATPVPDIVALSATPSGDGILDIAGTTGSAAMGVATADVGAAGSITATANMGSQTLPVSLTICQTNSTNGQCLAPAAPSVTTTIAANATPTFSIFAKASGAIPLAPATSRIFVSFTDATGAMRGSTSVAVRTQ
jgi:hypothetical protein